MSRHISNNKYFPHPDPANTHASTIITPPHPTAPQRPPTEYATMHTTTRSPTYTQPHPSSQRRPTTPTTTRDYLAPRAHNPTHKAAHPTPTPTRRIEIQRRHNHRPRGPPQSRLSHRDICMVTYKPGRTHGGHAPPITQLQQQYPHKLPLTSLLYWDTLLPTNTNTITPEPIRANFPDGIDIVIAGLSNYPKP